MSSGNNGGGFGRSRSPWVWLVPLVAGVALGGLFFSALDGSFGWGRDTRSADTARGRQRAAAPATTEQQAAPQEQVAPQPDQRQVVPQPDQRQFGGRMDERHELRRGGFLPWRFGFGPFGGLRLLVPLLLMGAGAWLLAGRRPRGGPGGGVTEPMPQAQPPAPPAARVYEAPPSTGETRRL